MYSFSDLQIMYKYPKGKFLKTLNKGTLPSENAPLINRAHASLANILEQKILITYFKNKEQIFEVHLNEFEHNDIRNYFKDTLTLLNETALMLRANKYDFNVRVSYIHKNAITVKIHGGI